jgi:hypothetical protein
MIHAWGKSNETGALERVESLFSEIQKMTKPSSYTCAAYQIAWSRSGRPDAAMRVEAILNEMQKNYNNDLKSRPGAPNFSIAINCWAGSGQKGAAVRAEAMLTRMEELYRSNQAWQHLKPTTDCYKGAIMAWALSGDANSGDRAIQLLDRMEHAHSIDPRAPVPRLACYHYALVAIGRSDYANKASRSYALLQRMKGAVASGNRHVKPISATYAIVLRSCAATWGSWEEKADAFEVAVTVLKEYEETLSTTTARPDEDVYSRFLAAAYRLLPANEARDDVLRKVFRDCPMEILRSKRIQSDLYKTASTRGADSILSRFRKESIERLFTELQPTEAESRSRR